MWMRSSRVWMRSSWVCMRSSWVVRASDCQCQSRSSPGFVRWSSVEYSTVHREKNPKNLPVKISTIWKKYLQNFMCSCCCRHHLSCCWCLCCFGRSVAGIPSFDLSMLLAVANTTALLVLLWVILLYPFLCRIIIWKILFPLLYYYIYLLKSPCQLLILKE